MRREDDGQQLRLRTTRQGQEGMRVAGPVTSAPVFLAHPSPGASFSHSKFQPLNSLLEMSIPT